MNDVINVNACTNTYIICTILYLNALGIVVGSLALIVMVIAVMVFVILRRRRFVPNIYLYG